VRVIRQWSTFHPEFSYLPRKFKFAVNGAKADRAAVAVHDIGLHALKDENGEVGFRVLVGGGLGRTPAIGSSSANFCPGGTSLRISKPYCGSTTATDGATTSTRRASRSW